MGNSVVAILLVAVGVISLFSIVSQDAFAGGDPIVSIDDVSMAEGNGGPTIFSFDVLVTNLFADGIEICYEIQPGTATESVDYVPEDACIPLVSIVTGSASGTITVVVNGDTDVEPDETFFVDITGCDIDCDSSDTGLGTIENDDTVIPVVTIGDIAIFETNSGTPGFTIDIIRSGDTTDSSTVTYGTSDGTATTANNDYLTTGGLITFDPGDTSKPAAITFVGDTIVELDENFFVDLSGCGGCTIGDPQASVTIRNDDSSVMTLISQPTLNEGTGGPNTVFEFSYFFTNEIDVPITYDADSVDTGSATEGVDYNPFHFPLTQPANDRGRSVFVQVIPDSDIEPDETFEFAFSNLDSQGRQVTLPPNAVGTILNDDFGDPCPDEDSVPVPNFILSLLVPESFRAFGGEGPIIVIPCADLSLDKTVDDPNPVVGDIVTYTITVTNDGPDDATNVHAEEVFDETLLDFAGFGNFSPGVFAVCVNSPVETCDIDFGTIARGTSEFIELTYEVLASGDITNTAEVSSSNEFDPDSTPGNGIIGEDDDDTITITATDIPCPEPGLVAGPSFILSLLVPEQFRAFGGGEPEPSFPCGSSEGDVFVVMGRNGNVDPENGSLATANLDTGLLSQVGETIAEQVVEGGGLSGLAIDSTGRFFVTTTSGGGGSPDPSILLEVDGDTGEILINHGHVTAIVGGDDSPEFVDVKVRDLSFQPGTDILFGVGDVQGGGSANSLFTLTDLFGEFATIELVAVIEAPRVTGIAFHPDGTLFAVNRAGVDNCDLTILDSDGGVGSEVQDKVTDLDRCYDGFGIDREGQMFTTTGPEFSSLHIINPDDGSDVLVAGVDTNPSDVDFRYSISSPVEGDGHGAPYDDPTLGIVVRSGVLSHSDGFCFDLFCLDVLEYFNHLPIQEVDAGSTHTVSLTVFCPHGAIRCNYASVGGTSEDINSLDWNIVMTRIGFTEDWEFTVYDPNGLLGDVTTLFQNIDILYNQHTFNIEFLTPASVGTVDGNAVPPEDNLFLVTEIRDSNAGSARNIFNEGIFVTDIYAYPQSQGLYQSPVEVEPLCLNEDPTMRYTCAFDLVRQWTIEQAEEKLKEMYNEKGNDMDSFDESERY